VECCPTPLEWLREVAGYRWELEYAVVHANPEHPKSAQRVRCLVSMQAMEELGHVQLPGIMYRSMIMVCIIMLKHEVMAAEEWHDNEPQDLVTVSLCIQISIDKMQLCSLSVACASPYYNPTTTGALCSQR
jgi:hypothetical protein